VDSLPVTLRAVPNCHSSENISLDCTTILASLGYLKIFALRKEMKIKYGSFLTVIKQIAEKQGV
jgi:hypothetical protein